MLCACKFFINNNCQKNKEVLKDSQPIANIGSKDFNTNAVKMFIIDGMTIARVCSDFCDLVSQYQSLLFAPLDRNQDCPDSVLGIVENLET